MSECMSTRLKNATQCPGLVDLNPPALGDSEPQVIKRRTKAEKAANNKLKADKEKQDQEDEANRQTAVQGGYGRIATLQTKMKGMEASQKMDAPRPIPPKFCTAPDKAGVTAESSQPKDTGPGLDVTGMNQASGVDPASEVDEESAGPALKGKSKVKGRKRKGRGPLKPVKMVVREAITAIKLKVTAPVNDQIDQMVEKTRDVAAALPSQAPSVNNKFQVIGHVKDWSADVPPGKLTSKHTHSSSSSIHPLSPPSSTKTSLSLAKSTLSKGITVMVNTTSTSTLPPQTPITTSTNSNGLKSVIVDGLFNVDDDEMADRLERQAAILHARKTWRPVMSVLTSLDDDPQKHIDMVDCVPGSDNGDMETLSDCGEGSAIQASMEGQKRFHGPTRALSPSTEVSDSKPEAPPSTQPQSTWIPDSKPEAFTSIQPQVTRLIPDLEPEAFTSIQPQVTQLVPAQFSDNTVFKRKVLEVSDSSESDVEVIDSNLVNTMDVSVGNDQLCGVKVGWC
ncbi:hypothetical protein BDN67DRAFT_1017466 [Paxillus ammoniavirescens]|nr:hypothetical protein BDN67DRAFT_1017466 [Paxillus ammoniavirescens]